MSLQHHAATQLTRRPTPDQPRSQRLWAGQLEAVRDVRCVHAEHERAGEPKVEEPNDQPLVRTHPLVLLHLREATNLAAPSPRAAGLAGPVTADDPKLSSGKLTAAPALTVGRGDRQPDHLRRMHVGWVVCGNSSHPCARKRSCRRKTMRTDSRPHSKYCAPREGDGQKLVCHHERREERPGFRRWM